MTEQYKRNLPLNELDLQMQMIETVWGSQRVNPDLRARLAKNLYYLDEHGEISRDEQGRPHMKSESRWDTLAYFTQDMRLGNLTPDEVRAVRHYLDIAGDCLAMGYLEAFLCALRYSASYLELSQSRKGFLRKLMNTLLQEQTVTTQEAPKASLRKGD